MNEREFILFNELYYLQRIWHDITMARIYFKVDGMTRYITLKHGELCNLRNFGSYNNRMSVSFDYPQGTESTPRLYVVRTESTARLYVEGDYRAVIPYTKRINWEKEIRIDSNSLLIRRSSYVDIVFYFGELGSPVKTVRFKDVRILYQGIGNQYRRSKFNFEFDHDRTFVYGVHSLGFSPSRRAFLKLAKDAPNHYSPLIDSFIHTFSQYKKVLYEHSYFNLHINVDNLIKNLIVNISHNSTISHPGDLLGYLRDGITVKRRRAINSTENNGGGNH